MRLLTLPAMLALALGSAASAREEAQPLASVDASLSAQQPDDELARAQIIAESFVFNLAQNWQVSKSYLAPDAMMCFFDNCMSNQTFRVDLENWSIRKCQLDRIAPARRVSYSDSVILVRARWYCGVRAETDVAHIYFEEDQVVSIYTFNPSVKLIKNDKLNTEAGAN
ncbi:hypothetical protein VCJ71_01905 [Alteriqipengyuania sp. WL0013]|uniref:hypothetical protein n=1 Tax=Alteriqipengyuania sp. WL0013 TaxID=3110773 RepID=UPI002BA2E0EF|nr:hypothetical protein [Alteriqipengyuania sp. WL0013]MEB3414813.1 hypothetical protein [Alteriqipengyuania sp. WL0013]